jgi:aryl-alcohol dehydrogenase-like predicted oxidoreductase
MAVLGQGTWHFGVGRHPEQEEIAALRLGLSLGMTVVDTAEICTATARASGSSGARSPGAATTPSS